VEGKGVMPDVRVTVTREDLVNGRDPVLTAAIATLSAPASGSATAGVSK
jgi:C-terminal processing protease CtpA/Prc